jgi:hypothetical protein
MRSNVRAIAAILGAGLFWLTFSPPVRGQEEGPPLPLATLDGPKRLPDAPAPQIEIGAAPEIAQQTASSQAQDTSGTAQSASQQSSSSSSNTGQAPASGASPQQTQHEKAEEELKQQETQRVAGIMATFNTTRNPDATPLSPDQKFRLFLKSAFDPWPFGLTAVVAGIGQADDSYPEWGQGMQGYAKRYGAAYSDYFLGNFFGNAVLPSLLREDPRYFQKGSGKPIKRILWAATSTVWCRRDNGTWGPNYANVGGNLIGSAIARAYYPASYRTVNDTITDGLTVTAEGIVGAEVIEFWPDLVRHHRQKQAEKQARALDAAKGAKKESAPDGQNQP